MGEPTVKCDRCHLTVLTSKLNPPAPYERCLDHRCPLHTPEKNAKLTAAFEKLQAEIRPQAIPVRPKPIVREPDPVEKRSPPPRKVEPATVAVAPQVEISGHGARVVADLAARKAAREREA